MLRRVSKMVEFLGRMTATMFGGVGIISTVLLLKIELNWSYVIWFAGLGLFSIVLKVVFKESE